jgi:hypothetical protein
VRIFGRADRVLCKKKNQQSKCEGGKKRNRNKKTNMLKMTNIIKKATDSGTEREKNEIMQKKANGGGRR